MVVPGVCFLAKVQGETKMFDAILCIIENLINGIIASINALIPEGLGIALDPIDLGVDCTTE